jgi:hypothetical protein
LVLLVTSVQRSTLRISRDTSTVHEAGYSAEQNNTQLNLAILSILSDSPTVKPNDIDDAIDCYVDPAGVTDNEEDEYESWKRSESVAKRGSDSVNYPIKYWVGLQDRYPNISKFAIDMLSIPGSSCECERMFSELGDLLEPRRRNISPQLLAAIQCNRRWIRAGFGAGEVPVKDSITDEEMDVKYGVHKWDCR